MKLHHGCDNPAELLNAIADSKQGGNGLREGLHLSPSDSVARNYGKYLITFVLLSDVSGAHVGQINKDGNSNRLVGHGVEVVLNSQHATQSFVDVVDGAQVKCPDGRVATVDVTTGAILCVE